MEVEVEVLCPTPSITATRLDSTRLHDSTLTLAEDDTAWEGSEDSDRIRRGSGQVTTYTASTANANELDSTSRWNGLHRIESNRRDGLDGALLDVILRDETRQSTHS
jgi:hypothetical protein